MFQDYAQERSTSTLFRLMRILIEIPALDRLMDYLESAKQAEIDAITSQVSDLTRKLKTSQTGLQDASHKDLNAS